MPLTLTHKTQIARHLDYPVFGFFRVNVSGQSLSTATNVSFRYTQAYGMLLWRLGNLSSVEESIITGENIASIQAIGPTPTVNDTSTITISAPGYLAAPVVLTLVATDTLIAKAQPQGSVQQQLVSLYFNANIGLGLVSQLAFLVATNPTLVQAGFTSQAPYGVGPWQQQAIPVPEMSIQAPFPFSVSIVNGPSMALQTQNGNAENQYPSMSVPTSTAPIYGFLPILSYLEGAYASASQDLSIDTADVYKARKTELSERYSLYRTWVSRLGNFMDIPINPDAKNRYRSVTPRAYL